MCIQYIGKYTYIHEGLCIFIFNCIRKVLCGNKVTLIIVLPIAQKEGAKKRLVIIIMNSNILGFTPLKNDKNIIPFNLQLNIIKQYT